MHGATGSSNFPMPGGSYDNSFNGGNNLSFMSNGTNFATGTDIFICRFNASGTNLLGATFMGGSDNDGVNHVNALVNYNATYASACPNLNVTFFNMTECKADSLQWNYGDQFRGELELDRSGNVYVASSTRSSNFPTLNPFDNSLGGKQDAVVFKLDPSLSNLIYSSYLGGSGNDAGYSLIVNDSAQVYITGGTYSTDFPTSTGCYNTTYNGGKADGYIAKINASGNAILKATYIETGLYDQSYFVANDKNNNIYVFGESEGNMPIIGPVYSNANSHQFISKLNSQLTTLIRSTVIGSGQSTIDISPSAFMVDVCGNIYLSGWGGNITNTVQLNGMPVTGNALYPTPPNGFDFYFMSLAPDMSSLIYGSYFGGSCSNEHVDGGTSRFDKSGKLYQSICASCGGNDDFPVTPGAWPSSITTYPPGPNLSTNCNNGLVKFNFQPNVCAAIIQNTLSSVNLCAPVITTFSNNSVNSINQYWTINPGNFTTLASNPNYTFTIPGNYTLSLIVTNSTTCNGSDTSSIIINIPTCAQIKNINAVFNSIKVYPNPSKGVFTISMDATSSDTELEVYNSIGQLILSKKTITSTAQLDLSKQANGIYYLKLKGNSEVNAIKLIKE